MAFKIGDVVQLKGGSPIMTVTEIGKGLQGEPRLTVTWFDQEDNEKTAVYQPEALKLYEDEALDIPTEHDDD